MFYSCDGKLSDASDDIKKLTEKLACIENTKNVFDESVPESAIDTGMQLVKYPEREKRFVNVITNLLCLRYLC